MTDSPNGPKLSRRQFLVFSMSTTVAVTLPAIIGCTPQSPTTTPVPNTSVVPTPIASTIPQPTIISSQAGVLQTSLLIKLQSYTLAGQPLALRMYGTPKDGSTTPNPDNDADWVWSFPGPTFRLKAGDRIKLKLYNRLPPVEHTNECEPAFYPTTLPTPNPDTFPNCFHENNATNLHFHGMHVAQGEHADDVFLTLYPNNQSNPPHSQGETMASGEYDFDFVVPTDHPQGTFWYHPHKHGATDIQIANGMAGAIIVEDTLDADPVFKDAKPVEYIFILQSIEETLSFPNGQLGPGTFMVNGDQSPLVTMQAGEIQRWRLINATGQAATSYQISFEGQPGTVPEMYLIAVDGNFISSDRWISRKPTQTLFLAPGNRADFLVQAQHEGTFSLGIRPALPNRQRRTNAATPTPIPTATIKTTPLLTVQVQGIQKPPMQMPAQLPPLPNNLRPIPDSEIVKKRTLTFGLQSGQQGGAPQGQAPVYTIDGKLFDACVVNHCVVLNTAEEWTIVNKTPVAHPFHIHLNPFVIRAFNDPTPNDPDNPTTTGDSPIGQWQDTIIVPARAQGQDGSVTIRHRFPDITGKFVLHCHILGHEDRGMMQIVEVVATEGECQANQCTS